MHNDILGIEGGGLESNKKPERDKKKIKRAASSEYLIRGFRPGPTQTGLYRHKKIARGCKFLIKEIEDLYYLCHENQDADQAKGMCQEQPRWGILPIRQLADTYFQYYSTIFFK